MNAFLRLLDMVRIWRVKDQSRVFTARCSEPQVCTSNGMDEEQFFDAVITTK